MKIIVDFLLNLPCLTMFQLNKCFNRVPYDVHDDNYVIGNSGGFCLPSLNCVSGMNYMIYHDIKG